MRAEPEELTREEQSGPAAGGRRTAKAILLACIFALLFLREPKCITHPEFWAEDGTMFFRQQLLFGARAILMTAGGYLDLVARLLALLAAAFPVAWTPLVYAIESILVAGVCCWTFVLDDFRGVLRSDTVRGLLCLLAAAAFPAQELIGNLTNLQWFFSLVAVPLVLAPPLCRTVMSRILLTVLGLLISLSEPLTIILLPLIALHARRTRRIECFGIAITAGTLVEWTVIASHWPHPGSLHGGALGVLNALVFTTVVAFTNQVIMFSVFGRDVTQAVWKNAYGGFSLMLLLAFAGMAVIFYTTGSREYRRRAEILIWLIGSSLALAMLRGMESVFPAMSSVQPFGSHRYYLLACWCFAFLVMITIMDRRPAWPVAAQAALAAAIFAFGAMKNFAVRSQFAAEWKPYAPAVQAWQADRKAGREHPEVMLPISPRNWVVELPELRSTRIQ